MSSWLWHLAPSNRLRAVLWRVVATMCCHKIKSIFVSLSATPGLSFFCLNCGGQAAGLLATAAVLSSTSPLLAALLLPLGWIYARLQRYYRSSSRELRRLDSTSRCVL